MFRKILLATSLLVGLNSMAMSYEDDSAKVWRDGFITGFKAIKTDAKVQGLTSQKIATKKYIIYFNANSEDIAEWDKLMVQMYGYTSSITQPIRTTSDWIIFNSFDNKATAIQELEMLNDKIFKGSEKYSLKLYENKMNKVFYNSTALLTKELVGLKKLLKDMNRMKLDKKKKELEENQKVMIVYVDKNTNKIIENYKSTEDYKPRKPKAKIKKETRKMNTKTARKELKSNYVRSYGNSPVAVFSRAIYNKKYKLREIAAHEVFEVESKDGYGWFKLKGEKAYVASHVVKYTNKVKKTKKKIVATTNAIRNAIDNKSVAVKRKDKKKTVNPKTPKIVVNKKPSTKEFIFKGDTVLLYKLNTSFKSNKKVYSIGDFSFSKNMNNDYENRKFRYVVKNSDGFSYVKLLNQNLYVDFDDIVLIDK